jgi:tRNA(fMet)-specific endonuclease VapC
MGIAVSRRNGSRNHSQRGNRVSDRSPVIDSAGATAGALRIPTPAPAPVILLDTDACSLIVRGGSKRLDAKVRAIPPREVCISAITRAEMLAWSNEASAHYAHIRAYLESKGEPIGNMDQMIAAHARSAALPLVSSNAKHFRRVPGLEVLDRA